MKRLTTIVLLVAICFTAQGQEPNPQLRQLGTYLQEQGFGVRHSQSNVTGKGITHQWSSYLHFTLLTPPDIPNSTDEKKQLYIHATDSINALHRRQMDNVLDSIRLAFARLGKDASESYLYEYHKGKTDTIKYSLAFRMGEDSLRSIRYGNQVYFSNAREMVSFDYQKNYEDKDRVYQEFGFFSHFYSTPNPYEYKDMKPFDIAAFEALLKPLLKPIKKLKGVKTYPVYWRHDEGYKGSVNNDELVFMITRQSEWSDNKHTGLATGTYYFIPAQYQAEAEELYRQMDELAYQYVNDHPEQPYDYSFTKGFSPNNLRSILEGIGYEGSDEYSLMCMLDSDGYHILFLTIQGELWIPQDWQKLKSYINGEKVYR